MEIIMEKAMRQYLDYEERYTLFIRKQWNNRKFVSVKAVEETQRRLQNIVNDISVLRDYNIISQSDMDFIVEQLYKRNREWKTDVIFPLLETEVE